jgi:hypothetical protein
MTTELTIRNHEPQGEVLPPSETKRASKKRLREVKMMPEFDMESRGHQVHPIQCRHRRRCYYYREWSCADCGEKL